MIYHAGARRSFSFWLASFTLFASYLVFGAKARVYVNPHISHPKQGWVTTPRKYGPLSTFGYRLIHLNTHQEPTWVDPAFIEGLIRKRKKYFDVTDIPNIPTKKNWLMAHIWKSFYHPIPISVRYEKVATHLMTTVKKEKMESFIENFCSYTNRMAINMLGKGSQTWLRKDVIQPIIEIYESISVEEVALDPFGYPQHFKQNTIIVRMEGNDPTLKEQVVVLGAHLDSISSDERSCLTPECLTKKAPGASDAAGVAVILESLRVLAKTDFKRTVEFHFYAGGEYGLRGSLVTAAVYEDTRENVVGVLCFDTVGNNGNATGPIAIYKKDTHPRLNQFLRTLIDKYLGQVGWVDMDDKETLLSDYAAWSTYGFPSAFLTAPNRSNTFNTGSDTVDTLNFDSIAEFAKLAVVFLVEFGEATGRRPRGSYDVKYGPSLAYTIENKSSEIATLHQNATKYVEKTATNLLETGFKEPYNTPSNPNISEQISSTTPEKPGNKTENQVAEEESVEVWLPLRPRIRKHLKQRSKATT